MGLGRKVAIGIGVLVIIALAWAVLSGNVTGSVITGMAVQEMSVENEYVEMNPVEEVDYSDEVNREVNDGT